MFEAVAYFYHAVCKCVWVHARILGYIFKISATKQHILRTRLSHNLKHLLSLFFLYTQGYQNNNLTLSRYKSVRRYLTALPTHIYFFITLKIKFIVIYQKFEQLQLYLTINKLKSNNRRI